jgi:hypothetical protein
MGKYNLFSEKEHEDGESLADQKRFCRKCKRQSYRWTCCGARTSRVNMNSTVNIQVKKHE